MACNALRNVPRDKLEAALKSVDEKIPDLQKRIATKTAVHAWFNANIPVKYWNLEIINHNNNNQDLVDYYNLIVQDIPKFYAKGKSYCFAGNFGLGKTLLMTSVLKRLVEKKYSGLYTSLTDILSVMKTPDQFSARKELITTNLLVLDEFDPRYMPTDASADFCGRILEDIIRNRSNNKLPILMATNSPSPWAAFDGALQQSLFSLKNYLETVPFIGDDYRKKES